MIFVPKSVIWAELQASGVGLHALVGLPDAAGLVPMDPAEVPNQLECADAPDLTRSNRGQIWRDLEEYDVHIQIDPLTIRKL